MLALQKEKSSKIRVLHVTSEAYMQWLNCNYPRTELQNPVQKRPRKLPSAVTYTQPKSWPVVQTPKYSQKGWSVKKDISLVKDYFHHCFFKRKRVKDH